MKRKFLKAIKVFGAILLVVIIFGMFFPTWTPSINVENSISELKKVEINGTELEIMIRGVNKDNPAVIFVHGGPCCSEIPYVRKYQNNLEDNFTIVHYDQRGSGKSYNFTEDYSDVTTSIHVNDLIALTQYILEYLNKEQVILIGHSYGTYIATSAAAQAPELYTAYVGIGQMADVAKSEMLTLDKCISAASDSKKDVAELEALREKIAKGEAIVPRNYVRNYGFAARKINDNTDYLLGFAFGTEYNLLDAIRFYTASIKYQDKLIMEAINTPLTEIVTELQISVYFVMGKYDGMTAPEAAEEYLNSIRGDGVREMVIFENSAHYPQFEEKENFNKWMCSVFQK